MSDSDESTSIAGQLAEALKLNEGLRERLAHKSRELEMIQAISAQINATLELDRIYEIVLRAMDEVFGFRHAMVLIVDEPDGTVSVRAVRGFDAGSLGATVKIGVGVIGIVAKKRRMMRIGNLRTQRLYAAHTRANVQRAGGVVGDVVQLPGLPDAGSQIAIPLMVKDRLIGVFAVESEAPNAFDELDEVILKIVANQVATAIDNADAYARQARLTEVYGRYVPREFLACLGRESVLEIRRGDHVEREMSVLFSDIRSFTTLVEGGTHQENFAFINRYFAGMEPAIRQAGGFVDSYEGDAVMALFPGVTPEAVADDAVRAGVEMQRALEAYNCERAAEGKAPLAIGIGVNTGRLILGTIGSTDRMKCGVIGDPVNLAARIEAMNKLYGSTMLISEFTRAAMADPGRYALRLVDRVRVKGKSAPVTVYEVLDGLPDDVRARRIAGRQGFAAGWERFQRGDIAEALACFEALQRADGDDAAVGLYVERCRRLLVDGLPPDWEGVVTLTSK